MQGCACACEGQYIEKDGMRERKRERGFRGEPGSPPVQRCKGEKEHWSRAWGKGLHMAKRWGCSFRERREGSDNG